MRAFFKKDAPIILAIHQYCDSFGTTCGEEINKDINHGLNINESWIEARADHVAGVIGVLASMGHGSDFLSAH